MRATRLLTTGWSFNACNSQTSLTRTGSPIKSPNKSLDVSSSFIKSLDVSSSSIKSLDVSSSSIKSLDVSTSSIKSVNVSSTSSTSSVISRTNLIQSFNAVSISAVNINPKYTTLCKQSNSQITSLCDQSNSTPGSQAISPVSSNSTMGIQSCVLGFRPRLRLASKTCEMHFSRTFMKQPESLPYTGVSLLGMKRFLRMKSIEFTETHPCLVLMLPKHILNKDEQIVTNWEGLDKSLAKIYVNKTTGNFICPEMELLGSWTQIEELITIWNKNKNAKRSEPKIDYPVLKRLDLTMPKTAKNSWNSAVPIESLTTLEFKDLLKNFKLIQRDFDVSHFSEFEVRVTKNHDSLLFPVKHINGTLIGVRRVYVDEKRQMFEENLLDSKTNQMPFHVGLDKAINSESARCVVVSNVLDAVVISARTSIPVITLADWSNLHPDHLPYFHQFEAIYFWMTNDQQEVETSRIFARKIDEKRCHLVLSEHPGAVSAVRKKMDVNEILSKARKCSHEYITTFDSLRHDVFLELANYEELEGVKWKRFDQLNNTLKGFRRGELTVVTGKTGSGKTTFISEYSLDLCMQGVNTLWGSFEVHNVRLARMLLKQFSLVNLEEHMDQFDMWADKFTKLPLYFTTFHGTAEVDKVMDAMGHAVYVHDIAHVIIDNMQFMMGAGRSLDKFQLQDMVIERLRKFATLHNCHVTLVIHPRKEDEALTIHSIFGGAKATQEADNVLLLQDEQAPNSFLRKKFIQVAKNRFSGDLGILPLNFVKSVMSFSKKANQMKKAQAQKKVVKEGEEE